MKRLWAFSWRFFILAYLITLVGSFLVGLVTQVFGVWHMAQDIVDVATWIVFVPLAAFLALGMTINHFRELRGA